MSEQPAYVMARLTVKNHEEYMQRYALGTGETIQKAGGEVLVATPSAEAAEGEWVGNWTVILRFPDMKAARGWYESADYEPLRDLRKNELTEPGGSLVFLQGFDPAVIAQQPNR